MTLPPSWQAALAAELASPSFQALAAFVYRAYREGTVYPPEDAVFAAFNRTPFNVVKVVILGQDPYHEPNQAQGLAFSVPDGVKVPPSLRNIYKELEEEYHAPFRTRGGDLSAWADQGVLLLNATLTVAAGRAGSHQGKGWEAFTDAAIRALATARENLVFILWGAYAQKKAALIDPARHCILKAAHPSPLSAYHGFFGCNHFRLANDYLAQHGLTPIAW